MPDNRIINLRGMLNRMDTWQLDAMLRAELEQEQPDGDAVRILLSVLEDREKNMEAETGPEVEEAWQTYIARSNSAPAGGPRGVLVKAASVGIVLVFCLTLMPQKAEAENIWDRIVRWSGSVFELFSPDESRTSQDAYVFRTDNPGLQQVYDTLVAQGVTEPVVPMWIPEGYDLVECKVDYMDARTQVQATFLDSKRTLGLLFTIYDSNLPARYYKNVDSEGIYEYNGTVFNLIRNEGQWVVVWEKDNVECSIAVNCQEEMVYQILRSIYAMEEN